MALTANRELNRFVDQELRSFSVAAGAHVLKGSFVGVERSTGHVRNLLFGDQFTGIAYEEMDNTSGLAGELSVRLYTQGDFVMPVLAGIQSWVGGPVYATDDESTVINPPPGASFIGVLMAVTGLNLGIVRIMPPGAQQVEHAFQLPLVSSTTQDILVPAMIVQRGLKIINLQVSFNTVPDQGTLDVGTTQINPDEVVNTFNLTTLSPNTPNQPLMASRDVLGGTILWVRVTQATATAGDGGLLSIRYVELP